MAAVIDDDDIVARAPPSSFSTFEDRKLSWLRQAGRIFLRKRWPPEARLRGRQRYSWSAKAIVNETIRMKAPLRQNNLRATLRLIGRG